MAKGNIRSMRFSDEMIEMIESQVGDTFTAKFEALVTRCMWELPRKEQELKGIQERIDYERKQLAKNPKKSKRSRPKPHEHRKCNEKLQLYDKEHNKTSGRYARRPVIQ